MKNLRSIVFVLVLLLGVPVIALAQCDSVVLDPVNMFGPGFDNVLSAARQLADQGATVRVRTVAYSQNLDITEKAMERDCSSWQGGNGARKSNLIVILVSKNRKVGMYYGPAWHKALDDHWNRIQTDYMIPRFKQGDYAGGLAVAETQLTSRLVASKDEALHPVQNNTTVQATNYSGLWTVLLWLVGILALGVGIYLLLRYLHQRNEERAAIEGQRRKAILYRNQCASLINTIRSTLTDATALSNPKASEAQSVYDDCLDEYSRYQKSVSMDPDSSTHLSNIDYSSMAIAYEALYEKLLSVRRILNDVPQPTAPVPPPTPPVPPKEVKHQRYDRPINPFTQSHEKPPTTSTSSTPTTPNPEVVERTVVVNNGINDMLTGILVGESLSNSRERELDREERERTSFGTRSSESYHSKDEDKEDSNSGGSTDWSSDPSSDSDSSGGSSDFSSDSSDSGSGGSDDF